MKAILRLMAGLCPDRELSASKCQLSAMSYQPSATSRGLITIFKPLDKPKKSYHLGPFLLLILVFVSCGAALAQESVVHTAPAAKAETEIKPLKIGDKIPDELWEMYFPVVSAKSDEIQYLSLGDFKDKLIILDFWATWCSSCIEAMPKVHELQKEFGRDVIVLSVTKEDETKTTSFLKNNKVLKNLDIPSVVGENELGTYFPHKWLPHIVWIGKDGSILATTSSNEVTNENIKNALKNNLEDLSKIDIDYNLPLFSHPALQNTNTLIYSVFIRGYQPGLPAGSVFRTTEDGQIYGLAIYNATIGTIYSRLYRHLGKKVSKNDIILSVKDTSAIWFNPELSNDRVWREKNLYTYELMLPIGEADSLYKRMIDDLNKYSGYHSRINNGKIELFEIKTPK